MWQPRGIGSVYPVDDTIGGDAKGVVLEYEVQGTPEYIVCQNTRG